AFSTAGMSLGITESLTTSSKLVIIMTMFIGRVGTLTILSALIKRVRTLNYKYPEENVFII
ncbi:MAG TPA: potassium transporter TrkG, partial [Cytophagaceae bacterium]